MYILIYCPYMCIFIIIISDRTVLNTVIINFTEIHKQLWPTLGQQLSLLCVIPVDKVYLLCQTHCVSKESIWAIILKGEVTRIIQFKIKLIN